MRSRLPHCQQRYNLCIGKQTEKRIKTVELTANSGFIAIGRRLALNVIIHWYGQSAQYRDAGSRLVFARTLEVGQFFGLSQLYSISPIHNSIA